MYITINGTQYPCANYRASPGSSASFIGVEGMTMPVVGEIVLYADDGFELARQFAGDYARHIYENGTLTLTNEPEPSRPTIKDIRAGKLAEISAACQSTIIAGVDVDTEYGTEHFSLDTYDQINISNLARFVDSGAPAFPYHADGKECVMYTAADILKIVTAATQWITYNTTYHNFLKAWVNRESNLATLEGIVYGAELPEDLAAQLAAIMAAVTGGA